jgi:phosphatidylinositol alpha-1,6-mannosyltransferase
LLGDDHVKVVGMAEPSTGKAHLSRRSKFRFIGLSLWQTLRFRPDLIVCTHLALGSIGRMLSKLRARSYWVVTYGIEAWVSLPRLKRAALRKADQVIAISRFSRDQIVERQHVGGTRFATLPCSLDETLLAIEHDDSAMAKVSSKRRVVLTVARMQASERYKGHDAVLQAMPSVVARVPDVLYVIAGDGDDRPRLQSLALSLGLDGNVIFTGTVNDSQLAGIYRRSEAFILPARTVIDDHDSKGEGFGIVFLEAMAFGKPVIGPNYGAPVELIHHGQDGLLVDPDDPASIAAALVELLENPQAARRMGEAGRGLVHEHYSYDSFRHRLGKLIGLPDRPVTEAVSRPCES